MDSEDATLRATTAQPALIRLSSLAAIGQAGASLIERAAETTKRTMPAHREIVSEGQPLREASLVLAGWACRARVSADGRRQILGFLVPGDIIGRSQHQNPLAPSAVHTLTAMVDCLAPQPGTASSEAGLNEAYAVSAALDECHLYRQIMRLGRLDAYERVADLLLELHDRLLAAGLAQGGRFALPLTQETLADALGLTSVHVNRTLQTLRADGTLTLRGGIATLHNPQALASRIDYRRSVVTRR